MANLKDTWKHAGKGLGFAFRDFGLAIAKTAKTGIHKVDTWANKEDEEVPAEVEAPAEPVVEAEAKDDET